MSKKNKQDSEEKIKAALSKNSKAGASASLNNSKGKKNAKKSGANEALNGKLAENQTEEPEVKNNSDAEENLNEEKIEEVVVEISDEELEDLIENTDDDVMRNALVALQQKNLEAVNKQAELLEMVQRQAAEFANYRKRTEGDKATWRASAEEGVLQNLLPVLDSYESALSAKHSESENGNAESSANSFLEGFTFIYKQLQDLLARYNVEESTKVGDVFNPSLHRAIKFIDEDVEEDAVAEIYQKGFISKGKILREATVLIHKKKTK